jgi:multidrug efflux pump subunit AcrA (membrane-fusion protein)
LRVKTLIGELQQTVVASGRVIWLQRVDVAAEITGRVGSIPVMEGQQVTQNQLLIQLEDEDEHASALLAMASVAEDKLMFASSVKWCYLRHKKG